MPSTASRPCSWSRKAGWRLTQCAAARATRAAWREVAAVDPSFCGVRERRAVLGEEKPEEEPDAGDDDMESFDDLIAEVNAVSAGETLAESEPEVIESEPKASRAPPDEETPPAKKQRRKKKISFV